MFKPKQRRQGSLARASCHFRWGLVLAGVLLAAGFGRAHAADPATAERRIEAKPEARAVSPAASPEAGERSVDFVAVLRELRSALHEVSTQRAAAQKGGDKVREICLYERQRSLAQALESAEVARVAWESAKQYGELSRARDEQARAQRALELGRSLRSAAESCGGSVPVAAKPTTVAVAGPGQLDDPQPGPRELAKPNPLRLELPSRPNPASAFRQAR